MHRPLGIMLGLLILLAACEPKQEKRGAMQSSAPVPRSPTEAGASLAGSYLAGRFAYAQNDLPAATQFMTQTLTLNPDNTDLLRQTFMLELSQGNNDAYSTLAQSLRRTHPDDYFANLVLFIDSAKAGDYEQAHQYLDAMPDMAFQRILQPLTLGWLYAAEGREEDAINALEALKNNTELASLGLLHQALVYQVFGDNNDAEILFSQSYDAAEEPPLRLVYLYARFLQQTGKSDKAEAIIKDYQTKNPQSMLARYLPQSIQRSQQNLNAMRGLANAFFDVASLLNQGSAREAALIYARLAHTLNPDFAFSAVILGDIFIQQQRYDEALGVFTQVDKESPFYWLSQLQRAQTLEQMKKLPDAIALLTELVAQQPDLIEIRIELGDVLRRDERFTEAIAQYSEAIKRIDPNDTAYWGLFYARGIAFERAGNWPAAEADLKQALHLQPEQPYVMNYLAYSWVDKGLHLDEAYPMLRRAMEAEPNDGYIIDSYAWAHYKLGDYKEAVRHLERAIQLLPHDVTINDHLGDAYWQVGRRVEARFQWQRALSFNPEPKDVVRLQRKLEYGLEAQADVRHTP